MPDGERGGLAAARAAGGASGCHGLRVSPRSERVGVHAQAEVGQVGAGDRDRAGGAHALDHGRVDRGDRLGQRGHAVRGRRAGDVDVLLDRERDAVQRAEPPAAATAVGGVGGRARLVGEHERIALRWPLTASMRSRCASTTSREVTSRVAIN